MTIMFVYDDGKRLDHGHADKRAPLDLERIAIPLNDTWIREEST